MTQRTNDETRTALEDLLQSEGWQVLMELVDARFGHAAQLAEIDAAMAALTPADTPGQLAVVTQIRAASKAAYTVLALPQSQVNALKAGEPKPNRIFEQFRRGPRTA